MNEESKRILDLRVSLEVSLATVMIAIRDIENAGYQNTSWFLDYLDELNKLSVKH